MAKTFAELIKLAESRGKKKIAVAVAQDHEVLLAIQHAVEHKIAEPILVGDRKKIEAIAQELNFDVSCFEIIEESDGANACRIATELVSSGRADILMKGLIDTSIIMKQVLDKEIGLRTDSIISHCAIFSVPTYHKMFIVTDAAMNLAPDLEQKKKIIENAVAFAKALDIENPKVAVLAAKEKVNPKMQATVDANELKEMNQRGQIQDCVIDGPLALDNAISHESARIKGIDSPVAGEADILVTPNIESGNVLYKSLTYLSGGENAGIIVGTKAPIVLTSRADSDEAKLNSIAMACLMAK